MIRISKTLVAGISALAMAAAVVLPTAPASAGGWRRRWLSRRRVHGGGWHGGGWGGGWHGGGWGGRGVWHGGYWRGGYWNNGWWGPAIAAGVIGGAAIASYPYWGGGYGRRRLLAGSPHLRRLRQFPRPAVRQRLRDAAASRFQPGPRASGALFHVRAGQKTPPVIGFGAPVVVGNEIGRPRRERSAR